MHLKNCAAGISGLIKCDIYLITGLRYFYLQVFATSNRRWFLTDIFSSNAVNDWSSEANSTFLDLSVVYVFALL